MLKIAFIALAVICGLIVLAAAVVGFGGWSFQHESRAQVDSLLSRSAVTDVGTVTADDLERVPPVVRKWLRRSKVVGRAAARTVRVRQNGRMQTTPQGRWMPYEAEQWFTTEPPGFVWTADVQAVAGLRFAGRDSYIDGRGHMLIRLLSLLTVADTRGAKMDQGALVRYLAETVWFPSAALQPYIEWEELGPQSARATMTHGDVTASGVFTFDEYGDVRSFEAKRYREGTLEVWFIELDPTGYTQFGPLRLPAKATVTWKLADGDWTWLELEIESVDEALHEKGDA